MAGGVITIRRLVVDDLEAAAALEAANQPSPWSAKMFSDELAAPGRSYLVAEDIGLVGFGGVMVVAEEAHITNLLVDPVRRGEGIGRRLLVSLIEAAIDEGARHLTLEVRVGNQAARSLYSSFGLVPVGARPRYYGEEDALILWAHDIDSPEYQESLK